MMSFVVRLRQEEVSIRMAIGASSADILRLLVRDGLRPVVAGLAAGLAGACMVTRWFARPLSINPFDGVAISAATATLMVGALLAVVPPRSEDGSGWGSAGLIDVYGEKGRLSLPTMR